MNDIGAAVAEGILAGLWNFLTSNLFPIAIFFGLLFLIFLGMRALLTWYWKIDRIVSLLEQIEANTRKTDAPQEDPEPRKVGPVPTETTGN